MLYYSFPNQIDHFNQLKGSRTRWHSLIYNSDKEKRMDSLTENLTGSCNSQTNTKYNSRRQIIYKRRHKMLQPFIYLAGWWKDKLIHIPSWTYGSWTPLTWIQSNELWCLHLGDPDQMGLAAWIKIIRDIACVFSKAVAFEHWTVGFNRGP